MLIFHSPAWLSEFSFTLFRFPTVRMLPRGPSTTEPDWDTPERQGKHSSAHFNNDFGILFFMLYKIKQSYLQNFFEVHLSGCRWWRLESLQWHTQSHCTERDLRPRKSFLRWLDFSPPEKASPSGNTEMFSLCCTVSFNSSLSSLDWEKKYSKFWCTYFLLL